MRTTSRNKKTVCVLGPRLLQDRLVAHYLEKMTKTKCHAARTLDEAGSVLRRKLEGVDLFLWDCEKKDLAPVLRGLGDIRSRMPAGSLLALFNVGSMSLRGRKASDSRIHGVFLEGDSIEEIATGVSSILGGKSWIPTTAKLRALAKTGSAGPEADNRSGSLTPREKRILALLQKGKSNLEIADTFGLKIQTVKNHIYRLFKKINVKNRNQAVLWAKGDLQR
jgi:DNA-binding NarL/FixJ family response regulator